MDASTHSHLRSFRFLDFEASGLGPTSWPIEVGISRLQIDEKTVSVKTWSSLVQPEQSWEMRAWSDQSAQIHGITLECLFDAPPARSVAATVLRELNHCTVLSDAPKHETQWLDQLLSVNGHAGMIPVDDFHETTLAMFDSLALDNLYEFLERHRAPHRAGPDSARLAAAWKRAVESYGPLAKNK